MLISIQTINTVLFSAERQRFRRLLKKLETFNSRIIRIRAQLSVEGKGPSSVYQCAAYLSRPGANLFASAKKSSAAEAVSAAAEGLRKQLRKVKTSRRKSLRKREPAKK